MYTPRLMQRLILSNMPTKFSRIAICKLALQTKASRILKRRKATPDWRKIYAYYYWLFPNLMFNFYPWGLSLNVVEPQGLQKTRIRFRTYLYKDATHQRSLNNLEATELEDEAVVESVQRGIQSRYYHSGRFSPAMEQGVHRFSLAAGEAHSVDKWTNWQVGKLARGKLAILETREFAYLSLANFNLE